MSESDIPLIIGILIAMVFSAFFSGMEIAFVSSNRMLAEMDKDKQKFSSRFLQTFYRHPNNFVSTMLVGNNIALVVYGILFAELFDHTLFKGMDATFTVPADTILSTLIVLFTGEFLPKTLFKSNANRLLTFFALPAYLCYVVLWPISRFSTMLSRIILRIFGFKVEKEKSDDAFTKVDLDYLVQSSIDNAENEDDIDEEVKIFQNALDFADTKVRDCMVPRTEIKAVEDNCSLDELMTAFVESGKSKIIVYHEDIDHITGYIHSSEMFREQEKWLENIQQMPYVPETMTASKPPCQAESPTLRMELLMNSALVRMIWMLICGYSSLMRAMAFSTPRTTCTVLRSDCLNTMMRMPFLPLIWTDVVSFSHASSTSAISLMRMVEPLRTSTTVSRISSRLSYSPGVRSKTS